MTQSVTYETWCQTCVNKEEKLIRKKYDIFEESLDIDKLYGDKKKKMNLNEREKKRKLAETSDKEIVKFKYIGETSRSAFERGVEHFKDLEYTRSKSHMLKHAVIHHPDLNPKNVEFGMKIISSHRSAFERQITEAVLINRYSGYRIMNSKLEYNRCSIPKISLKTGNKEDSKDMMLEIEKTANERIKTLYEKSENKRSIDGSTKLQRKKKIKMDNETPGESSSLSNSINLSNPISLVHQHCKDELNKSTSNPLNYVAPLS